MRNLKRTLSLLLAAIMLIGMMVVGASAADVYDSFTDKDEIVNKDAVNLLTILNIINGKEDGSHFDPKGGVTRAEMAKMIAVVLNRGRDNNDLYKNANTGLTDIKGNWAEGNINFCYQRGIIAGRGDGRFDPTAPVTASEAAKMLLVAAGYDADIEGYVGANWAMNVNIRASAQGIYNNYNGDVMANLSRDDAALLIYNALDVEMIEAYSTNNYAQRFGDKRTILSTMYGVYKVKAVVTGNEWAQLEDARGQGTDVDERLADGRTLVSKITTYTSNTQSTVTNPSDQDTFIRDMTNNGNTTTKVFNISTPVDYLGKTVTMYVRKTTILNDYEVLGVYLRDVDNDIVTKDASNTTKKALDGSGLKVDSDTRYYVNYGIRSDEAAAQTEVGWGTAKANGIDMELIDNDKDGVIDYVLYLKRDLTVVATSKDDIILYGFNDNKTIDDEDIVTDLDLDADDVVLAVTYGGRYYVEEPEVVTGKMTAYNNDKTKEETIDVDGTTYKPSGIGILKDTHTSANGRNDIVDFEIGRCDKDNGVQFKTTYEFFLDTHGYIRAFRPTEESLPKYALILDSGYNPGVFDDDATGKVSVLLEDGTKGTYSLNFSASASNLAGQIWQRDGKAKLAIATEEWSKAKTGVIELKGFLGTSYTDNSTTRPWRFDNGDAGYDDFIFAYQGDSADSATDQARKVYGAGNAAGYVIAYTLNDDNVMTIKNVIGSVKTGAVGNGNWNNFRFENSTSATTPNLGSKNVVHTLRTDAAELDRGYGTGDANVVGTDSRVTIDRNTIAFYYDDTDPSDVKTAVAVGYQNMGTVDAGYHYLASTVVRSTWTGDAYKYENTNLADVILFDDCPNVMTRDYAYVLSANTVTEKDATLNVVFENGEAGTLVISRDDYDDNFTDSSDFKRAWAYAHGANGIDTIDEGTNSLVEGDGFRQKNGTFQIDNIGYPYDVKSAKIWNVTDLDKGENARAMSDFSSKTWHAFLVLDSTGNIRTAFMDEDAVSSTETPGAHPDHTWAWRLDSALSSNYRSVNPGSVAYNDRTSTIQEYLNNGYDVLYNGSLDLTEDLNIPADRILKVDGALDAQNNNISGNGSVSVMGNLTGIRTTLSVANVYVSGTLTLTRDVTTVSSKLMYVGNLNANSKDLTVAAGADLHVGYGAPLNTTGSITACGTLTVNGHLDVTGSITADDVVVNSINSLIVGGNLTADSLTVSATSAGKVVVEGTLAVKVLEVNAKSDVTLEDVTITADTDAKVALKADITVNGKFDATNAKEVSIGANTTLTLNGEDNILAGASTDLKGAEGAAIAFGEYATLYASDASGIQWTEKEGDEADKSVVGGVTFEFSDKVGDANEDGFVATPETVEKLPAESKAAATVTVTLSDYVTADDAAAPTVVTFDTKTSETTEIDLTVASEDTVTYTVDGEAAELTSPLKLVKGSKNTTIVIHVSGTDKASIEKTITVVNGQLKAE